jgi:arginine/lysine/ornithine decarboxylase
MPIVEAMEAYRRADTAQFAIPGHKAGRGVDHITGETVGYDPFRNDILEMEGFDDRRGTRGIKELAQQLAAKAYGSEKTFFSTGGSSLSAHVSLLTLGAEGDKVLIGRNCHKSVIAGLILSGANPVFVRPDVDDKLHVTHCVAPAELSKTLEQHPEARGVLVTNPTYYGFAGNIKALAETCHERKIPLVVDEAWGSHFPFHADLPMSAMASGADMSYVSLHKTETAISQSSLIHLQGKLIDPTLIENRLELMRSTSESGIILASIDACRRQMATQGQMLLQRTIDLCHKIRNAVREMDGLEIIGPEYLNGQGAVEHDITKILIDVRGLGINGFYAGDWLRDEARTTIELSDHRYILAIVTVADDEESVSRLIDALQRLTKAKPKDASQKPYSIPPMSELMTESVIPPREAYFAKSKSIPLKDSIGEIAAEMVSPYPPGIPMLLPGERITAPIVEFLQRGMKHTMYVSDVTDLSLKEIMVVDR